MSLLGIVIIGLMAGVTLLARNVPTGDYMLSTFQAGQGFYSEGAYDQAIEKYKEVGNIRNPLLDDREIAVTVGEVETTVKDAALYQVGNSYFKMFEEEMRAAESARNSEERKKWEERAQGYLEDAVSYFSLVEESARSEKLRVLAQSRITTCWYNARRYKEVIREGRKFIEKYPDNPYVADALYNIGWAYYELKDYANSIGAFGELTERFTSGYQVSRALFQIGECYYDQGHYADAIPYYQQLVDRENIGELSEQDIQNMQREKIAGLVDETAYELTAKAQIRIGDCYGKLGEFDKAEASYRTVISVFFQERRLVEKAYQSLADMYFANRLFEKCADAYREAIDRIPDKIFQARMQFQLAQRYREASEEGGEDFFDKAIREYNVYIKGYGEVAERAGYSLANTQYEIGQVLYEKAERLAQSGEEIQAEEAYRAVVRGYTALLENYPEPRFTTTAKFNIALAKQRIGEEGERREATAIYREIIAETAGDVYASSARFQLARMSYEQGMFAEAEALYTELISAITDSTHLDVAHFELGLALRKKGELSKAAVAFLAVREAAPQFSSARLEAGRAVIALEDFARALEVLEGGMAAASDGNERAQYHYLMGKARLGKEEYGLAVEAFTQAIDTTRDPALKEIAQYDRGMSFSRIDRYEEAERDLRALANSENEKLREPAQKMLGMAYLKLNKQEEALENYSTLVETAKDPTEQIEYMVLMTEIYLELEQYDKAIEIGRQILAMDIEDKKEHRDYWFKEKAYYLIGECQQRKGQYEEVIETYSEGFKRYPNSHYSADMAYVLGTLYFQLERLDEAVEILSDFAVRFPGSPNILYAYYYRGYASFNLREFERSAEIFKALVERFPSAEVAPEALFRAAESAYNLRNFDEAIALYRRLLQEYPSSPFSDDAMYNIAWGFYELQREGEFIQALERLLETFPQSEFAPDVRFSIGDYYYNSENYERALTEYQKVLADYPHAGIAKEVPKVLENLQEITAYREYERAMAAFEEALALEKQGEAARAALKFAEASPAFSTLAEKYPGTEVEVGALNNLGICYEFLHKWKEAVSTYDRVISLFQQNRASEEAFKFAKGHREWIATSRL